MQNICNTVYTGYCGLLSLYGGGLKVDFIMAVSSKIQIGTNSSIRNNPVWNICDLDIALSQ